MTLAWWIYVGGLGTFLCCCSLALLSAACVRGFCGYVTYVKTGTVDKFDVMQDNFMEAHNPCSIIVDTLILTFFSILLSLIWPVIVVIALFSGAAWCNRCVYLRLKSKERIMARLGGTDPYGEQ